MKTVQYYFKEADVESLIKHYLYKYPIHLHDLDDSLLSVKVTKEKINEKLRLFIHRLSTMKIEKGEDAEILFAHQILDNGIEKEIYSLVRRSDLLKKGEETEVYNYLFVRQEQVVGYYVADTKLTQRNIYGLLVDVMHTVSWFGYEQEYLEKELKQLEEIGNASAEYQDIHNTLDNLREKLGFEKRESDPNADSLKFKAADSVFEYQMYSRKKELKAVYKSIIQ